MIDLSANPTAVLGLQAAHAALLVGTLVVAAHWAKRAGHAQDLVVALLLGAVWFVVARFVVGPELPVTAFQMLREGYTVRHLREVSAQFYDLGIVPPFVWRAWLEDAAPTLRNAVTTSLVMAGWTLLALAVLVRATVPSRVLQVGLLLGFALQPAWWTAALSPLHASFAGLTLVFAVGMHGVAVANRGAWRWLAAVCSLGWWGSLAGVRDELIACSAGGVVALGVALLLPAAEQRWTDAVDGMGAWIRAHPVRVGMIFAVWLALSWWWFTPAGLGWGLHGRARWVAVALHPLSPHVFTVPVVLLGTVSLGLLALVFVGAVEGIRRPASTSLLLPTALAVYLTARIAAHGAPTLHPGEAVSPFELYRYVMVLVPLVCLGAILGARRASAGSPRWQMGLAIACVLGPIPWAQGTLNTPDGQASVWPWRFGFEASSMTEVHHLATRLEAHPTCAVLTQGFDWRGPPDASRAHWAALVPHPRFAGGWRLKTADLDAYDTAEEAAAGLFGEVSCGVAFRAMDCVEQGTELCGAFADLDVLQDLGETHVPFLHPRHGAVWPDRIPFAWLALEGWASQAP